MDFILALISPFLVMILVTRIAYSLIGAVIVTWMISIFAFGFHEHWMTGMVAFLSFIAGLILARKKFKKE